MLRQLRKSERKTRRGWLSDAQMRHLLKIEETEEPKDSLFAASNHQPPSGTLCVLLNNLVVEEADCGGLRIMPVGRIALHCYRRGLAEGGRDDG